MGLVVEIGKGVAAELGLFNHFRWGVVGVVGHVVGVDRHYRHAPLLVLLGQLGEPVGHVFDERAMVAHEDEQQGRGVGEIGQGNGPALRVGEREVEGGRAEGEHCAGGFHHGGDSVELVGLGRVQGSGFGVQGSGFRSLLETVF